MKNQLQRIEEVLNELVEAAGEYADMGRDFPLTGARDLWDYLSKMRAILEGNRIP